MTSPLLKENSTRIRYCIVIIFHTEYNVDCYTSNMQMNPWKQAGVTSYHKFWGLPCGKREYGEPNRGSSRKRDRRWRKETDL